MSTVLHRLGMVGVILVGSAFLFGALASAVVVHRLETTHTASNQSAQGDEQGEQHAKPAKTKHANHEPSGSPEPDDSQDKDA